jgi:hypothetical protein
MFCSERDLKTMAKINLLNMMLTRIATPVQFCSVVSAHGKTEETSSNGGVRGCESGAIRASSTQLLHRNHQVDGSQRGVVEFAIVDMDRQPDRCRAYFES